MDALIQKFMELLTAVPIIPLIIAFSLLRRFISKKPEAAPEADTPRETMAPPPPENGYGRPRTSAFDTPKTDPEFRDPSIDPAPADSLFGGKYGTTKYGFDESEWGSTFGDSKERDRRAR
jgi:hypothetical protein